MREQKIFAGKRVALLLMTILLSVAFYGWTLASRVQAAPSDDSGFSLQVSPSPLVATLKPGTATTLDLQIRNTSIKSQTLKMGLRTFTINNATGQVNLTKQEPTDVSQFITFSNPTFSVEPGQIFIQHLTISLPASAAFTYSFATVISQVNPPRQADGKTAIQGSVADFTLLTVDRPGATAKLELSNLTVSKHVYEYLPADISLSFKNTGNTLLQPKGNLFIQRGSNDNNPITSIPINQAGGYILPGTSRTLTSAWNDGFPHYVTDNNQQRHLSWQRSDISKLRFGRYVAKVVAVYNVNGHDQPLTAEVSFWVIPWRALFLALFLALFIILVFAVGLITTFRKSTKALRPGLQKMSRHGKPQD